MKHARSLPPRRRRLSRSAALLGLVLTGWGCQQPPSYFYFGSGAPGCVPVVPPPPASVNSNVGDPPTEVIEGGTSSINTPSRTTTVFGSQAPSSRVLVSQPENRSRTAWHASNDSDSSSVATSVETGPSISGDPTVVR